MQQPPRSLFAGFCVLLLGAALLGAGAWFSSYRPAVGFATAAQNETRRDIAPLVLIAAGSALLLAGGFMLLRRRGS